MKLLLILGVLICLVIFFATRKSSKTDNAESLKTPRTGFLTAVSILALQLLRGVLGLVFVLVGLLATKVLVTSLFFVRVDTSKSQQDSVNFGGPLAFLVICGVLYFIYRMSSRLRAKVNEMHVGRGASDAPLIKKRWSLKELPGGKK